MESLQSLAFRLSRKHEPKQEEYPISWFWWHVHMPLRCQQELRATVQRVSWSQIRIGIIKHPIWEWVSERIRIEWTGMNISCMHLWVHSDAKLFMCGSENVWFMDVFTYLLCVSNLVAGSTSRNYNRNLSIASKCLAHNALNSSSVWSSYRHT
jgi:hypothetical protein